MAWLIADELVQIRGGRGYETAESLAARGERPVPAEQMLRDLRINRIFEGSTEIMHLLIAREAVDAHLSVAGDIIDPDSRSRRKARAGAQGRRLLRQVAAEAGRRHRASSRSGFTPSSARSPRICATSSAPPASWRASTFYAMSRWQGKMETKQGFLGRIVDIGAELFAMSAACVRAEMLRSTEANGREAYQLADTSSAVSPASASRNSSAGCGTTPTTSTARWSGGARGTYTWLEQGIVDPSGEGPWIADATPGPSSRDNVHRADPLTPIRRPLYGTHPGAGSVHGPDRPGAGRAGTAEYPPVTVIEIPGSKSITARALFLAAAARRHHHSANARCSPTTPRDSPRGSPARLPRRAGRRTPGASRARPPGPAPPRPTVYCRDGATTARFLPTLAAAGHGTFRFDASAQMRRRPLGPLTRALRDLGVDLVHEAGEGPPPAHGSPQPASRAVSSPSTRASPRSSSPRCCCVGPLTAEGLRITVTELVSAPYVEITLAMMRSFGVKVARDGDSVHRPRRGGTGRRLPDRAGRLHGQLLLRGGRRHRRAR